MLLYYFILVIYGDLFFRGAAQDEDERKRQEKLLAEVEARRRLQALVVPTDDGEVRQRLRALEEPVTLFGEGKVWAPVLPYFTTSYLPLVPVNHITLLPSPPNLFLSHNPTHLPSTITFLSPPFRFNLSHSLSAFFSSHITFSQPS
jgi:hypothetical protein